VRERGDLFVAQGICSNTLCLVHAFEIEPRPPWDRKSRE
jgi:hypothetical protein